MSGWRLVEISEQYFAGDEIYDPNERAWKSLPVGQRAGSWPVRRRLETGWREIAKEKPVAPCVFFYREDGVDWFGTNRDKATHWLPLPPLPERDEAEESWRDWCCDDFPKNDQLQQIQKAAFLAGYNAKGRK